MPATLAPQEDKPGVPMAPPLFFAIPLLVALGVELLRPTSLLEGWPRWMMGAAFVAAGLALAVAGYRTQTRAGTDPIPFHPSTAIVSGGPYRFTRNPMYVGFTLATIGIAFLAGSLWMLIVAPLGIVLIDRLVVVREERYLERKFGDDYLSYKRRVRRWL